MESDPDTQSAAAVLPVLTEQPAPGTAGGPLQVRNLEAEDIDFVARMLVEAFRDKFEFAVGKSRIETTIQQQASSLSRSPNIWHRYYVALYEGKLAGAMCIVFYGDSADEGSQCCDSQLGYYGSTRLWCVHCCLDNSDMRRGECYIDRICVDAGYRGKGIGKAMLDKAESEAREHGSTLMSLWVKQTNRAVHLYERQGYNISMNCCWPCTWFAVGTARWYQMEKQL
ncbi:uncharacterized protein [Branchiostoma lanceolatum]|uniref:uncharacterized protein isoform X1 n=2 Tax=Branchiostoma lanceolatum TaxID=7740 RepID=UPI0034534852